MNRSAGSRHPGSAGGRAVRHHRELGADERGSAVVIAVVVGVLVGIQLIFGGLVWSAHSWANGLQEEETLLPGTVVAGADVGGMSAEEARAEVEEAVEQRLREPITVDAAEQQWRVTPHELGARPRSGDAVDAALAEAASAGPLSLARVRWLGGEIEVEAPVVIDEGEASQVIGELAADFDQEVRDAGLSWSEGQVELVEHRDGRALYQPELRRDLVEAIHAGQRHVDAEVMEREASVRTDDVRPLVEPAGELAERALGHEVQVTADDGRWTVTPRELGAKPRLDQIVAAELDDGVDLAEQTPGADRTAPLDIPDEQLRARVDQFGEQVDVPARNAQIDASSGWVEFEPHQQGQAIDRDAAVGALEDALRGAQQRVDLAVHPVQPSVTRDDYQHVLLLRQNERRLYHYVDGEIRADWPVAVGAGGSPTPTGQFHVGAKRHRPTWHNPDPTGWGSDMPEVIEPGRSNPLGLRALNWMDGGRDTLIRFHGTAAESSIGTAGSQGCVRLTNDDVLELYDRVPSGAAIVSIREG